MLNYTGCDGVMIGRGLLGNPWLIKQTVDFLNLGYYDKEINLDTKKDYMLKHLNHLVTYKGEHIATLEMRTHGAWYIKGLPGASKVKTQIVNAKSVKEIEDIINDYFEQLK